MRFFNPFLMGVCLFISTFSLSLSSAADDIKSILSSVGHAIQFAGATTIGSGVASLLGVNAGVSTMCALNSSLLGCQWGGGDKTMVNPNAWWGNSNLSTTTSVIGSLAEGATASLVQRGMSRLLLGRMGSNSYSGNYGGGMGYNGGYGNGGGYINGGGYGNGGSYGNNMNNYAY